MRITRIAVVAAGLTVGLTACTSNGSLTGSTAPSASTSVSTSVSTSASAGTSAGASAGPSVAGVANPCVVGTWKSTGMNGTFDANGVRGTTNGGVGLSLTVAASGATVVDFTGMQPVSFSATAGTSEIKGQFLYGGKVAGSVAVPATATTTGVWKPIGATDWRTLTVTVDMISPVSGRVFDHMKIADFATAGGSQTGGSVDLQPILREAAYECSGNSLKLGPPPGTTSAVGTWVLQRA
ncbi:hypothetical protein HC028_09815 [Planosporangium flavigriseum]|uniref:Uncharacterized protein n=1 Tax=Planosporangium flavigriseum TaxID=373681 RepID=A0A8J3LS60_9ACTN|nr:hypothetical protein [Planosporangium flavigriseum]NJC64796.1 hypothetical protein [Planosporangium flavigriseum]GIG72666.1 hypothetical protein Pfl04_10700 [Planosporangium flavigriseum]